MDIEKALKKTTKQARHYLPLFSIMAAGIVGFLVFSFDQFFQGFIVVITAAGYVAWGIIHHKIHDDLHIKIIIEYILIAALGLTIVFSLLYRA